MKINYWNKTCIGFSCYQHLSVMDNRAIRQSNRQQSKVCCFLVVTVHMLNENSKNIMNWDSPVGH